MRLSLSLVETAVGIEIGEEQVTLDLRGASGEDEADQ